MSNIFNNYDNLPSSYIPNNTSEQSLCVNKIIKPLEVYDIKGNLVGYCWNRGDTVNLGFNITGNVQYDEGAFEDAATYLDGKTLQFNIYNFRYEVIYTITVTATTTPVFAINKELSDSLKAGNYYCSLTVIDTVNKLNTTIFTINNGKLYVK